jgi:hypothetical protein
MVKGVKGVKGVTFESQIVKQAAQTEQISVTRLGTQGRSSIAVRAEPAQQMRVAAEFGELPHLGKGRTEVSRKPVGSGAITIDATGPQC